MIDSTNLIRFRVVATILIAIAGPQIAVSQERFMEVGRASGVDDPGMAEGAAVADYDGDGDLDIFVSNWGEADRLYQNTGDGTFLGVAERSGIAGERGTHGGIWGDCDGDGDLDLYAPTCAGGSDRCTSDAENLLFVNRGDGTFVEAATGAGISDGGKGSGAAWGDLDGDGDLDLYLANNGLNPLYLNSGGGTFHEVGPGSGAADSGAGHGASSGDYDGDGDLDLYVANMDIENPLLLNQGDGTFVDATAASGLSESGRYMSFAWGDYDNDGALDLFTGNLDGGSRLYRNGRGRFTEVSDEADIANGPGAAWGDFDGDGNLDLYVSRRSSNVLHRNRADGTFERIEMAGGNGPSVAWADFDRDGDLDLYLGNFNGPNQLFRNDGEGSGWLTMDLVGTSGHRHTTGATVTVVTGTSRQRRDVEGGGSHGQAASQLHFGLPRDSIVDSLLIDWPSGVRQVLIGVRADRHIRIFEGHPDPYTVPKTTLDVASDTLVAGRPVRMRATVKPPLFEPGATITEVTADLSDVGGVGSLPMDLTADGAYTLDADLPVTANNGRSGVFIHVDQATFMGNRHSVLTGSVAVLPDGDLVLLDDRFADGIQVTGSGGAEAPVFGAGPAFSDRTSATLRVSPESASWTLALELPHKVELFGYVALRFAFHPGESTGSRLDFLLEGKRVRMLGTKPLVDLASPAWQPVEIRLEPLVLREIVEISFRGDLEGEFHLADLRLVAVPAPVRQTAVAIDDVTRPSTFTLFQSYPNPFNSRTSIPFSLPKSEEIHLDVYNAAGQRIAALARGRFGAGEHLVHWSGRDDSGRRSASGVYLYRLRTLTHGGIGRVVLLR